MNATTLRLGLSLMVMLGLWGERAAAQGAVFVVPTVPYEPAPQPILPPAYYVKPLPAPAKHLPKRVLNHFYLGCQANPWGSTGNFWSEAHWLFGSSRSFFGEVCVPNQPCADRRMQAAMP